MKLETWELSKIKPYKNNPRKNDGAVPAVAESIKQCGYCAPIIVDEDGVILAGHTRLKALKKLGWKEAEVIVRDGLTEEQKKKYRLLDNKTGEIAEWDMESLQIELADMGFDGFDFGFEIPGAEQGEVIEDEFDETLPEEPITKLGDIWQLGRHRLMCGDSTNAEDVAALMGNALADMVFTDPPWNVNYGATDHPTWKKRTIMNDSMSTDDFKKFMDAAYSQMSSALKDGGMVYVVMSPQEWGNNMLALTESGFHWSSTIIWNKDHLVMARKDYHTKYEPIWYGWKDGASRLVPLEDRKQSDVWDIDRPTKSDLHPTTKPVVLVARAIENSSKAKSKVIDLFGGSGTTLIACEQLNRDCYMMELDPKYCDVIVRRWEALTGEKAVKT